MIGVKYKLVGITICIIAFFFVLQYANMSNVAVKDNIFENTKVITKIIRKHPDFPNFLTEKNDSIRVKGINEIKKHKKANIKLNRFLNDSTNKLEYIYFEHIRKSGGTTMKDVIALRKYKSDITLDEDEKYLTRLGNESSRFLSKPGIFIHNERRSFPFSCLNTPRASKTLFVTLIRDPLQRWQSEFVYTGRFTIFLEGLLKENANFTKVLRNIGIILTKDELTKKDYGLILLNMTLSHKEKLSLLHENKDLLYNKIKHWMKGEKYNPIWKKRSVIASYAPNMITRFLSGNCECLAMREDILPYHIFQTTNIFMHNAFTGCPEGDRIFDQLKESDLDIAKKVVDSFDAAMPFEILQEKDILLKWLNYAAFKKNLRFDFAQVESLKHKKSSNSNYFVDIMQFFDLKEIFEKENALDTELHRYILEKYKQIKPTLLE